MTLHASRSIGSKGKAGRDGRETVRFFPSFAPIIYPPSPRNRRMLPRQGPRWGRPAQRRWEQGARAPLFQHPGARARDGCSLSGIEHSTPCEGIRRADAGKPDPSRAPDKRMGNQQTGHQRSSCTLCLIVVSDVVVSAVCFRRHLVFDVIDVVSVYTLPSLLSPVI